MSSASPNNSIGDSTSDDARVQEDAALWFARLRGDGIADGERAEFTAWLNADPRHRNEYDALERIWDSAARLRPKAPKRRRVTRALAGMSVIALVCGWLGWAWLDGRVTTDPGERRQIILADGSRLDVAPNSKLRVQFDAAPRRLELDAGRVVVDVAANSQRPFEVVAGGGTIRDIGTRFEVDVGQDITRVTVAEGMVEVDLPASGSAPLRVGAGGVAEYDRSRIIAVGTVDAASELAWTQGQLDFDAASLVDVVRALNRYRKTPIELADPSLADIRISGVFLIDDENAALRALERVAPVEFVPDGTRIKGRLVRGNR